MLMCRNALQGATSICRHRKDVPQCWVQSESVGALKCQQTFPLSFFVGLRWQGRQNLVESYFLFLRAQSREVYGDRLQEERKRMTMRCQRREDWKWWQRVLFVYVCACIRVCTSVWRLAWALAGEGSTANGSGLFTQLRGLGHACTSPLLSNMRPTDIFLLSPPPPRFLFPLKSRPFHSVPDVQGRLTPWKWKKGQQR